MPLRFRLLVSRHHCAERDAVCDNGRLRRSHSWDNTVPEVAAAPVSWLPMSAILIIEDEQRIREELATRLAERGHDVVTVGTAMDGVRVAVSGDHDVVVLDLGLPDVDGTEARSSFVLREQG